MNRKRLDERLIVGDLLEVKWRDSSIYLTQCARDDDFAIEEITSMGELISFDEYQIVLAGDTLSNGDVRRVIVIPRENIISV